jgi:cytochrome P450
LIIDECVVFFTAGAFTTSMTTSNMIMYLTQPANKHYLTPLRDEIQTNIIKPHLDYKYSIASSENLLLSASYEEIWDLKRLSNIFNETLRIASPQYYSSTITVTEDLQIGKLMIKKDD